MPWRAKRLLILFACGFVALGLAVVVLVRDVSIDTVLLAVIALAGGVAILVNNLPDDGDTP